MANNNELKKKYIIIIKPNAEFVVDERDSIVEFEKALGGEMAIKHCKEYSTQLLVNADNVGDINPIATGLLANNESGFIYGNAILIGGGLDETLTPFTEKQKDKYLEKLKLFMKGEK